MSQSDAWKKRPSVLRYRAFCDTVRLLGARLPRAYKITFLIPMPESWSEKKKSELVGKPHCQKPDASNLTKATEDALVKDDSVLWRIAADKLWSYSPAIVIQKIDPSIHPSIIAIATKKNEHTD